MSNTIPPSLLAQLYAQTSEDPYLMLVTLSHPSFTTLKLVSNTVDIVSRGDTYIAFPMRITLPVDDGETAREVAMEFDNVSQELIDEIRSVTTPIDVLVEMILASDPDTVVVSYGDLSIRNISYNKSRISARLFMDDFLNVAMTSEKYTPQNFPGLF